MVSCIPGFTEHLYSFGPGGEILRRNKSDSKSFHCDAAVDVDTTSDQITKP